MRGRGLKRMTFVIAICALAGAIAGIAGTAAAPTKKASGSAAEKKAAAQKKAARKKAAARRGLRFRGGPGPGFGPPGFGPLHSEAVVPNEDGTGFDTVTMDAGTLLSVDGNTIHIKQGTDKATYKDDAALEIPSDAKVFRNHDEAKLGDLKKDDHVRVIKGPKGTVVMAEDDAWLAQERKEHRGFHRHGFGPPGPPPAGAPAPGDQGGSNENGSNSGSESGTTNS